MNDHELAESISTILYDKKAKDIITLDVSRLTVLCDWMVIATGRSETQVRALADEVDERMAQEGLQLRRKEGFDEGRWIVLDYGTIMVHIFHQEQRAYYNLERLWSDGGNHMALPFDQTKDLD